MALQEIRKTIGAVRVTLWIVYFVLFCFSVKKTLGIGFVFAGDTSLH